MMLTMTKAEMLAYWRRALALAPGSEGCTVTVSGGFTSDAGLERAVRMWYLNLLDTAPPALLPTVDIGLDIITEPCAENCSRLHWQRGDLRRVLWVRLDQWVTGTAPIADGSDARQALARLASPFGMPGNRQPLAAFTPEGLVVAPAAVVASVDSFVAVADPGTEVYTLDESLLATVTSDALRVGTAT